MLHSSLFKEVFFQSRIPQLIGKSDFSFVQYNPAFCEFTGYTVEELASMPMASISHPDDQVLDEKLFSEILNGERNQYQLEKRYIHKSGMMKTGILTVSRVWDPYTGEEFLLGQILDITEKKQMEAVMNHRENKYRLLAEHSSDMIILHHVDFSFLYVSPSVKTVLGYEPEELIGKNPFDLIHPDDVTAIFPQLQELTSENNSMLFTYRGRKKDGSYRWLESTIKVLFDSETGELREIISVSRDIQHRLETQERLRKSEKLAVVGQMAAAVAHEIRNPLTPIKGFLQLFHLEKEMNPAYLPIILDELQRVEGIISEFLSIAKPYSNKAHFVDVNNLLEQVIKLMHTEAVMKKKNIYLYTNPSIPLIQGDPNSLKQVFANVIQNALDAISERGHVEVWIIQEQAGVLIRINDNGCGIPQERLKKLGEPFYSTKEKGTGLGLMTSFRIIESHNGRITIDSELGAGTNVSIWLPVLP
ncbi:PAS domain-containing sensor histidine kinase [Neobacillus muris]|uniref:PAS domain-containing sensor histidine kinase n=1 Tax=Neobacillus muris TaxID=2941334 RepID=UPI00203DF5D7|nr:PAS domain-containing sensor histidine kinase [Neobacillus muris]